MMKSDFESIRFFVQLDLHVCGMCVQLHMLNDKGYLLGWVPSLLQKLCHLDVKMTQPQVS